MLIKVQICLNFRAATFCAKRAKAARSQRIATSKDKKSSSQFWSWKSLALIEPTPDKYLIYPNSPLSCEHCIASQVLNKNEPLASQINIHRNTQNCSWKMNLTYPNHLYQTTLTNMQRESRFLHMDQLKYIEKTLPPKISPQFWQITLDNSILGSLFNPCQA